ncbi:MAG TPA: DUF1318 domain-containing protein [Kiritimatiellia bacterium]|jgi:uncharacterized protein YdbL (DUF1318 family)|nr:DUF1318 domain-containing protein [Kiritimatiellia bacterium]HOM58761.1 DUF1318 domain-containing protein [Kiritimatiellia bacterium]HOR96840.1 DUF1318 domain-containing protein [Kiritimatiellia bacterium]HPC48768.1 DUF1318 domain-containing protein [Kiritimatiellia bacterium]HPK37477.1 DUF1318 domain-containing protein [Kiritimatiellia bacterium]
MRNKWRVRGLMLACVLGCVCAAQADTMQEIKARRRARREQIRQLVQTGHAKEGDEGYLVAQRALTADQTALMQAENEDRKAGYTAIAQANGKSVAEVGRQAAVIQKNRRASKQ